MPSTPLNVTRAMCGTCVVDHIVYSPVAGSGCTNTARGSIAFGINRFWRYRSDTVTSASANSRSTSPASSCHV